MVYGRIYKAEFPNGKLYVGATTLSIPERAGMHINSAKRGDSGCPVFFNAIRKYGTPEFIEICSVSSAEELDAAEREWIVSLGTMVPAGYNIKEGGRNGRHSEETKRKMSRSRTGKKMPPRTPEQCLNYRRMGSQNHNFGKPRSAETRKRIGDAQRGEKNHRYGASWDEEHILMCKEVQAGEKNGFYGKKHRDTTKDKMSDKKRKLLDKDVIEIRRIYTEDEITQKSIAKFYGVSQAVISRAINGKRRCYANKGVPQND